MGGIVDNIKNKLLYTAQYNLLYIVSYYFTQENYNNSNINPFIMCQPKEEEKNKKINNYPLISFKFDYSSIKYTKYEYRQMSVLQMIMLTPKIFISLTDEGLQLWHDSFGIQKISAQFFDKLISINKSSEIINKSLTKFDNDLFFLTFEIIPKNNNKNNEIELKGLQFVLFSAKKIINEGKISELFSINKVKTAFPISPKEVFISMKSEMKIIDIYEKKIKKVDKNLELFKFDISFAKHLFNDIILLSSFNEKKSIIYSVDKTGILYFISDLCIYSIILGKNKVILIGEKTKEILLLPDMYVLSLSQYETDIFNSIENKSFYSINENSFLFINHKNKKLKEVLINENNELIITKEILCPNEFITFCPFLYTHEDTDTNYLLCSLFICREQTYQITNHDLNNLIINDKNENIYSSIKRLFVNYFELDKFNTPEEKTNSSFINQLNDLDNIFIQYSIIPMNGSSTLNFAIYKNKKLFELNSFYSYFEPSMKSEIVLNINKKDVYIISIIKNMLIYIIKINGTESSDKTYNYDFGNIKSKGIVNLGKNNVFIFYDKKGIIINIVDAFNNSKINPMETFLFPFNILYGYLYNTNIILVSEKKIFWFDYDIKKITKELDLDFVILSDENIENLDINILHIEDNIYILIFGLQFMLFNINTFEKIKCDDCDNVIKQRYILFFNSLKENFEIIKKDIVTNKVLDKFSEKTDEQRHKMKYLSNNRIFVGIYPNKFYIFETSDNTKDKQ